MKRYTGNAHGFIAQEVINDLNDEIFSQADYEFKSKQAFEHGRNEKGEDLMPECGIDNFHELVHAAHCCNPHTIARWNSQYVRAALFGGNDGFCDDIIEYYGVEACEAVAKWGDSLPKDCLEVRKRFYRQINQQKPASRPATPYTNNVVEKLREKHKKTR